MKRRKLLKNSLLIGTVGLIGGSSAWLMSGYDTNRLTVEQAIKDLNKVDLHANTSGWNISQIFNHLAQSIEYSMTGYPEHRSARFKSTLGQTAFSIFSVRGKMTHNLTEPIPGAPLLNANNEKAALNRLLIALNDFKTHRSALKPHFAYGELSHQEYTWAHVMHINNHLEGFV